MHWNMRQYIDQRWLLIGTCQDCVFRYEQWLLGSESTSEERAAIADNHMCHPIDTAVTNYYRKNILESYQHVLGEGWGTNLPKHMWYWPSKDGTDFEMISMPHIKPESLVGTTDEIQDQLFPFQVALGQLIVSDLTLASAFRYVLHVEVLSADSIRMQELLMPDENVCYGAQAIYTMDDEKHLMLTGDIESLDDLSNLDGILSVPYKNYQAYFPQATSV